MHLLIIPIAGANILIQDDHSDIVITANIGCDLKVKKSDGKYQDDALTAKTGSELQFKIDVTTSGGKTLVVVVLPFIDEEPMFYYLESSEIPVYSDEYTVMWGFFSNPPATITFKARILKAGTGQVSATVSDRETDESDSDFVEVTGEGKDQCCFPAGTKITMADGSIKNIEDVKAGDWVLSFDVKTGLFTSWMVKMTGNPEHLVYSINNDLIETTVDHPFYVKKPDSTKGWGAIDPELARSAITYTGEVLSLDVGDQLFTVEGEWVTVTSIESSNDFVQTYNLLSFSGMRTYFANGILVYEEHPPLSMVKYFLRLIINKVTHLSQFLLSSKIFDPLFVHNTF
jgi:hypothetical protein